MVTGVPIGGTGPTREDKIWNIFSATGDIAFAYSFSSVLINIQVDHDRFDDEAHTLNRWEVHQLICFSFFLSLL